MSTPSLDTRTGRESRPVTPALTSVARALTPNRAVCPAVAVAVWLPVVVVRFGVAAYRTGSLRFGIGRRHGVSVQHFGDA
jgi:hypothetical protein